jgi:hypothetical protein
MIFKTFISKIKLTVVFFFTVFTTFGANVFAIDPAAYFDKDTYVYLEIYPAEFSIKKVKNLFFSLMVKEKAESEWQSLEDYFVEDIGINILSIENLKSSGFNTANPVGIGMNYNIEKIQNGNYTNTKYNKYITILLPVIDSTKAFQFIKESFINNSGNRQQNLQNQPKTPTVVEIEKDFLLRVYDPAKNTPPVFIYRTDNFIIVSENLATIKKYASSSTRPLNKHADYLESQKNYEKRKNTSDVIAFFFINQKNIDAEIRVKPRLLFDNILMDNAYVKELAANCDFISGAVILNEHDLKIIADYTFRRNYLDTKNSFLSNSFNFNNQSFFPDNLTELPLAFLKWQTGFSDGGGQIDNKMIVVNNQDIEKFFTKLSGGVTATVPENMGALFKNNISFFIQDLPPLKDIQNYYLWKGYLGMNYNPAYFEKFKQYMNNLITASKNSKTISIIYSKPAVNSKKEPQWNSQWEFNISRFIKKYDKIKEKVVYEENIIKMYILADDKQIVITHDPALSKKIPPQSSSPLYNRLLPENSTGNRMIFSCLDIHKFATYIKKSSLAFSNNYLFYLEKINSIFFVVNRENNIITEQLIIKLDK